MVPEAWLEIGLGDLVTLPKALMDHDKLLGFRDLRSANACRRRAFPLWLFRSCQVDANN